MLDPKIPAKIAGLEKTYAALRFHAIEEVPMEMVEMTAHLRSVPGDSGYKWSQAAEGRSWGDNWSTAWFRGTVSADSVPEGRPLFVRADTGAPECMLLVDEKPYGVFDVNHPVRLVAMKPEKGRRYTIHLEAYAGHTFPGTQPFDFPSQFGSTLVTQGCRTYEKVEVVTELEDVSAFVFELRALRLLAASLDENSLRKGTIQAAFKKIFTLVYAKPAEVEEEVWRAALSQAREVMKPLLDKKNGPTSPFIGIVGHSHIDTAWLWPLKETWRKCGRTFSSILSLMDEFPEFQYVLSAALHADTVRRLYPSVFEGIQKRVKEGRWEINGAMWIEPDCNIPSGEALVRQCLIGQSATREMFGVTSDTLWQPDVFGYSAALPQILKGCDVHYFCTTKMAWNDTNRFPYDTFMWQGIDGTEMLAHFNVLESGTDPEALTKAWQQVQHKDVQDRRLAVFGHGDGGGGPTEGMIRMARLTEDLEGCPRAPYTTVSDFMTNALNELTDLPKWVGELYLELHRGTLTSIAAIKRFNRKCELALKDAEFVSVLALLETGFAYPSDELLVNWKTLLLNQFHDILPGSSIAEANDEAIAMFSECESETTKLITNASSALVKQKSYEGLLVANSLSWDRTGELLLEGLYEGMAIGGENVVCQQISDVDGRELLAVTGVTVPSLGYTVLPVVDTQAAHPSAFTVTGDEIRTPYAVVKFDEIGRIVSFLDLPSNRELVAEGQAFNEFLLGEDVPAAWDNWDIDRDQALKMNVQRDLVKRTVAADGPLQLRVRQVYRIGRDSLLTQDIVFHSTTPRVDFDTTVDWREKYQFLKVGFGLDVLTDFARHEIQFGHVRRSTHDNTSFDRAQFDVCAHKWTDVSENGFGVAFLNDCKYACTVKEGSYRLSLIKSGRHPDDRGDLGMHRFSYAIQPHLGGFSMETVVRPAYEFNALPRTVLSAPNFDVNYSLARIDAPNVIIDAVKKAEDSEAIVFRLYEAGQTGAHAKVSFGRKVKSVHLSNLLEEKPEAVSHHEDSVSLYFRPFEIKTLIVQFA
jgi:alpha-mannosidase